MQNNHNDVYGNSIKVAKRIAITMLCCLPFLIIFAYLMRNVIKSNGLQILCFIIIMGLVVLIEELIVRHKNKNKVDIEDKDVFK